MTFAQILAVVNLLLAFNVPQANVDNVRVILEKAQTTQEVPAKGGVGSSVVTPVPQVVLSAREIYKDFCLYHVKQEPQGGIEGLTTGQISGCNAAFKNAYWHDWSLWGKFDIHFSSSTEQ